MAPLSANLGLSVSAPIPGCRSVLSLMWTYLFPEFDKWQYCLSRKGTVRICKHKYGFTYMNWFQADDLFD